MQTFEAAVSLRIDFSSASVGALPHGEGGGVPAQSGGGAAFAGGGLIRPAPPHRELQGAVAGQPGCGLLLHQT